ncbi:tetratricopeptide repeat protein 36 isoform X2 [Oratosquilla oratoria]
MSCPADRQILNSIFNPLLPMGECVYDEDIPSDLRDPDDTSSEACEAKALEVEGVRLAEAGDVDEALVKFGAAIAIAPNRASGYNNRAQALRLQGKIDEAMQDLEKALDVSKGKGRAACQAWTQRAMVHRLQGHDEDAKQDFQRAADLGSEFAKAQLVQMNPYAALCNKMLHDVFSKLQRGEIAGV